MADCAYQPAAAGRQLYTCATGFAAGVTGGLDAPAYVVEDAGDSTSSIARGTLRWGVDTLRSGAFITFRQSMDIHLQARLFLAPNTTIDARGVRVRIFDNGLVVTNVTNVILHNLEVGDSTGDHDVVHVRSASRVWIDHCRVYNASRGTIDVVVNSTDVTISNCFLHNNNFAMLLGAADGDEFDKSMRVTVFRNWFWNSNQRQPHCRWGRCHVANNLYTNWGYYCLGGRVFANVRSDMNIFLAGPTRKEVTPWFNGALDTPGFDNTATIVSRGDLLLNGATFHEFSGESFLPSYELPYHAADSDLMAWIMTNIGPSGPIDR